MSATNRYAFIARSLVYFFITTGALIAGFTYFEKERIVTERVTLQERAASRMDLAAASIRQDFRHITATTLALSQSENLVDFLDAATPGNRSRVESEFLRWAAQERIYDQIRYIDEKGMERDVRAACCA